MRESEFEEFARARAPQLLRSAWLLCGDRHLAEDLVQETLAKVYVRFARLDNPAAYAQTTLVRTFLSLRRRRSSSEQPYADLPDRGVEGDGPELRLLVGEALSALTPTDRAVVVLRYLEDLSAEEVAARLRALGGCGAEPEHAGTGPDAGEEPVVNEQEMSTLLARAADAVPVDVESLVAGGVTRGRTARRRRRAGAGVAGALGVAAVVGAAVVLVPHGGSSVVVEPAGQPGAAGSTASASAGSSRSALTKPIPSSVLDEPQAMYTAAPDAALTLHNEAIHAALAQLLPAGTMGPILTDEQYPARDQGNHRAQFFLYDGALVTFIIDPAKGSETCESFAAAADPAAGYSSCRTVGDTQVMTESQPRAGLNAAMVWHHGYEITIISYDNAPAPTRNPALDGKKLKTVSDAPPLDVPTLVAVASSDAWFE